MNVVFLSPHFPPNFFPFCVRLKQMGATVLGIADEPFDRLRPELQAALTEYYRVPDMNDYEALLRGLGHFTARHGKLDRLDSMSEHWLEIEGRLREDFNIPGLRPAQLLRGQRKSLMKEIFLEAGIPCARGRLCRTTADLEAFVAEAGYPVVAKPDIGVGASKTYKLVSDRDLEAFAAEGLSTDYLVEEFVDGAIVTYDGLTDRNGAVVFESSMRYSRGVMDVVNDGTDLWYYAEREIPEDLKRAGRVLVDAFGVRERFFHFEFFRLADGSLTALEVNLRPPGGLTVDMWNYQNETDLFLGWAQLLVTGRCDIPRPARWFCAYIGRKHRTVYRSSHEEVVQHCGPWLVHHQGLDDVFSAAIGNHGYILKSGSLAELEGAAAFIQARA
ncbi:MAG: carboxylate--amine ligase [Acidobacteriota bacterium]